MVGERPKSSRKMEVELDRISELPEHIIEQIMSYLSIKDAVRTSLLSSKWRYRWAQLPNLALWGLLPPNFPWHKAWVHNKLVSNIIDQVLLLHSGPIHKFQLRELVFLDDCALDRWILHVTRSPVMDISLTILRERDQCYNLPSCLFSCQSFINLELIFCCLKPPPSFEGFSNLKRLGFLHVNLAQDVFENLVSSCPVLETLDLVDVRASSSDVFSHLNINAPSLRFFSFRGVFEGMISFVNTLFLVDVTVMLVEIVPYNINRMFSNSSNLGKFFVHLPHVQRLCINSYFLKYLAGGVKLVEVLKPCIHLNYLVMEINVDNREESLTARCLLNIVPNLQELCIFINRPFIDENITGTETNFLGRWLQGLPVHETATREINSRHRYQT